MHLRVLPLLFVAAAVPAADHLTIAITGTGGSGDSPMSVLWLVNANGDFVATLRMYSKDAKYYKDMTSWTKARTGHEKEDKLDAVVGPTIKWNGAQTITVPIHQGNLDLLSGAYTIRGESRKDKAGHYKSLKIPLPANFTGLTLDDQGYFKHLAVTVE